MILSAKQSWNLLFSMLLLACLGPAQFAMAQGSKITSPPEVKSAPSVAEVRELLQQLDTMTDTVRQSTAEQLGSRLLAELDFRPEIERLRGQRAALQQLHANLTEALASTSKQLEAHRGRLLAQIREIESQPKSDASTMERRKSTALQSSAPAIRRLMANQTEYSKQLKDLSQRLDRCESSEQSLTDQLSISLESGYVPVAPTTLPRENYRPKIRVPSEPSSPNDKDASESSKKLMQELGLEKK